MIHSFYTSLYQLLLNQDSQNEHNLDSLNLTVYGCYVQLNQAKI